jgi:mono/diheme cytochrome c family protein
MKSSFKLALAFALALIGAVELGTNGERRAVASEPDGKVVFLANCATCHQASGQGTDLFPALAGNKDVTGADPSAVIATVERGRNLMPSWKGRLTAADIAAVLTYVRSAWGNSASAVTEEDVAAVK